MTEVIEPTGSSGGQEQSTRDQAKEKTQEVAEQARQKAQEATGEARERLRQQVDQRSTQAGEQVTSTAGVFRRVGEELRKENRSTAAGVADQAAERSESLGGYLKEADADRILRDLEDFARRRPWAFTFGALAAGFVGSRFLKASSSRRYQASQEEWAGSLTAPARPGIEPYAEPPGRRVPEGAESPTPVAAGAPQTEPYQEL